MPIRMQLAQRVKGLHRDWREEEDSANLTHFCYVINSDQTRAYERPIDAVF